MVAPCYTQHQLWDKTDIVFPLVDDKQGKFLGVEEKEGKLTLVMRKAKRLSKFRQMIISQETPPGEPLLWETKWGN